MYYNFLKTTKEPASTLFTPALSCPYTFMPLRRYAVVPLCPYAFLPLPICQIPMVGRQFVE
jgi:hypothetical protein